MTICTHGRECLLGEVVDERVRLHPIGAVIQACWDDLPSHFPCVELDTFVVMPNHVHGAIVLTMVGAQHAAPLRDNVQPGSLGAIVRSFKSAATRRANQLRGTPGVPLWQRNFYEHIVSSEEDLAHVRQYIVDNPSTWAEDEDNPLKVSEGTTPLVVRHAYHERPDLQP